MATLVVLDATVLRQVMSAIMLAASSDEGRFAVPLLRTPNPPRTTASRLVRHKINQILRFIDLRADCRLILSHQRIATAAAQAALSRAKRLSSPTDRRLSRGNTHFQRALALATQRRVANNAHFQRALALATQRRVANAAAAAAAACSLRFSHHAAKAAVNRACHFACEQYACHVHRVCRVYQDVATLRK